MPLDLKRIQTQLASPSPVALYQRLRLAIQSQILDDTIQPGDALPPERDLHTLLHVSRSTVRQALRGLSDSGFVYSQVGAGSFVRKTPPASRGGLIGMISSEMNFYLYYAHIYASFSQRMRSAGYRVDMSTCNSDIAVLREIASDLIELGASGVAINPPPGCDIVPILSMLQSQGIPVVLVGRHNDLSDIDYVGADHEGLGYEATSHLLQLGHRRIAYVGPVWHSSAAERAGGYVRAMQAAGLTPRLFRSEPLENRPPVHPALIPYVHADEDQQNAWDLLGARAFSAVFCFNDETASLAQRKITERSLSIPHDVSVISIDNLPFAGMFQVPPTTFSLPGKETGQQAAALLLRRLCGENGPAQRVLLSGRLVQGLSTKPLRAQSAVGG